MPGPIPSAIQSESQGVGTQAVISKSSHKWLSCVAERENHHFGALVLKVCSLASCISYTRNPLEMQIFRSHTGCTDSETLGLGPSSFKEASRWFSCMIKFENQFRWQGGVFKKSAEVFNLLTVASYFLVCSKTQLPFSMTLSNKARSPGSPEMKKKKKNPRKTHLGPYCYFWTGSQQSKKKFMKQWRQIIWSPIIKTSAFILFYKGQISRLYLLCLHLTSLELPEENYAPNRFN